MRLNKTEQEEVRKRVNILIPQMEKSEIMNHFQKKVTQDKLSMIHEIACHLEGQSTTKRKLVAQHPGHLPERVS